MEQHKPIQDDSVVGIGFTNSFQIHLSRIGNQDTGGSDNPKFKV